jgi:hypothetical protein
MPLGSIHGSGTTFWARFRKAPILHAQNQPLPLGVLPLLPLLCSNYCLVLIRSISLYAQTHSHTHCSYLSVHCQFLAMEKKMCPYCLTALC